MICRIWWPGIFRAGITASSRGGYVVMSGEVGDDGKRIPMADRLPVPLKNTVAGYLSFPRPEVKEGPVRMLGAYEFRAAPESLEPDRLPATPVTSHWSGHSSRFLRGNINRFPNKVRNRISHSPSMQALTGNLPVRPQDQREIILFACTLSGLRHSPGGFPV